MTVSPTNEPHRTRPIPIGWMTLVIAGVLYFAGSNIGSGWVVILSAAMGAAVIADLVAVHWTTRRTSLSVRLDSSATTTAWPALRALVDRPGLGTTLQVSDRSGLLRAVITSGSARIEGVVPLPRGHHTSLALATTTHGPLGLARSTHDGTAQVDVWCRPGALPAEGRLTALTDHQPNSTGARRPVNGHTDVRSVREFSAGDPRRSVHWRATARQGRLMVREMDQPVQADLRIGIAAGEWTVAALDLACEAVASICTAATHNGFGIQIAVDGGVHEWDDDAHHLLAALPPASGFATRPLQPTVEPGALTLRPATEGVLVDSGDSPPVLVRDRDALLTWLRDD